MPRTATSRPVHHHSVKICPRHVKEGLLQFYLDSKDLWDEEGEAESEAESNILSPTHWHHYLTFFDKINSRNDMGVVDQPAIHYLQPKGRQPKITIFRLEYLLYRNLKGGFENPTTSCLTSSSSYLRAFENKNTTFRGVP